MTAYDVSPLASMTSMREDSIERVRELNFERIAQHVCAFLNGAGGILEVGVDLQGHVVEMFSNESEAREAARQLEVFLALHLSPNAIYSINPEKVDNSFVLIIQVPGGPQPPYSLQGRIWLRVGAASQLATGDQLTALLLRAQPQNVRWERQSPPGATLEDLDLEEVERAGRDATTHHFSKETHLQAVQLLDAWGLLSYGAPTNAALVLFGRAPAKRFPQMRVRLVHFASEERDVFVTRVLEGHLFQILYGIMRFLEVELPPVHHLSDKSLQRQQQTSYPFKALREAVLNALVHRDYSSFDGGISLSIYPDRLEIWNSGQLPEGLTLSDLPLGGISRPRNPDIAYVLFQVGLIERLGIGGLQIVSACQNAGLPSPQWTQRGGGILLTFRKEGHKEDASRIPERARQFIASLSKGQRINAADYHSRTEVSARQARTDLSRLVEQGFLQREGSGPNTTYKLTDKQLDN